MLTHHRQSKSVPSERPVASVLIATDFGDQSRVAAIDGFKTASLWGTCPHVVHVCSTVAGFLQIERNPEPQLVTPDAARQIFAEYVEQLLDHYRSLYGAPRFNMAISHVLTGDPADCITELAKELQAALIVVGASKKSGLQRVFLGSTAERLVRHATRPVLVARERQADAPELIEPPCQACVDARQASGGTQLWCAQHRARHDRRHSYHYQGKNTEARENFPLLFPMHG